MVKSAYCHMKPLPGVLGEMSVIFPKKGQIHLLLLHWYCLSYIGDKFCPVWLMGSLLKILSELLGYLPFFNTDEHYIDQIKSKLLLFTPSWIAVMYITEYWDIPNYQECDLVHSLHDIQMATGLLSECKLLKSTIKTP